MDKDMKPRLIASENQEQRALVRWMKMQPKISEYVIKLNNEGKRTKGQGFNLLLMGMCPGASDLFLAYPIPSKRLYGLWLEVKQNRHYLPSERKKDSWQAQESFIERMKGVGYAAYFCFGWEEGKSIVEEYLAPLKRESPLSMIHE